MTSKGLRNLLVLLISFGAPCATTADFPSAWPKPNVVDDKCHSLSGTYNYYGESPANSLQTPVSFDRGAFNRMSIRGQAHTATVDHDLLSVEITVSLKGEQLAPLDRTTFKRSLKCENGWSVHLFEAKDFGNGEMEHVNFARTRTYYTRATDGSLLVRRVSEIELDRMFRSPEKRNGEAWYRFAMAVPRQ